MPDQQDDNQPELDEKLPDAGAADEQPEETARSPIANEIELDDEDDDDLDDDLDDDEDDDEDDGEADEDPARQ